ncbi:branched-chain amino acid ABC transporter permease [Actinomadura chibensis]|uniref:Branched-chain amino acid ABC transporter permease n=1 Tax=Actinomadura chibensis TaxID=392828 RepID=A0A5D0NI21_9ACTN|nr:branched-chain amino acid ABC transporter permease [Actinomadura chibensis]TYB43994.1 branched-chain amino acid ABC transporter permease [Actinomadura chibensis]
MAEFLQLTLANVTLAAVYLLIGQGWNLNIAVSGLLNLAIGGLYMFGGMLSFQLAAGWGLPAAVAALLAVAAVAAIALVVERLLLRPAGDRVVVQIIATIGVSMVLMEAARHWFGVDPVKPPALLPGDPVPVGPVPVTPQAVCVIAVAIAGTVASQLFFRRTDRGRAMRACADNPEGARGIGIDVPRQRTIAYTAAGALAALAGVLIAPLIPVTYAGGDFVALKAFMAIAVVGLGDFAWAPAGALAVASIEGYVAGYVSSDYRDVVVLSLLLAVLLAKVVRPSGRLDLLPGTG